MTWYRVGCILTTLILIGARNVSAQEFAFKSSGSDASLVELFSSEGCSSCPPAEAWIGGLKSSPKLWTQLFPVAFHVDYWDGLGWPDRFARPAYTQRQRDYASRLGQKSVYTPEMVLNGREWRSWSATQPANTPTSGVLKMEGGVTGHAISSRYSVGPSPASAPYSVNVALLGVGLVSQVQRGENSGRKLEQNFVVLDFKSLPLTKGSEGTFAAAPFDLKSSTGDQPGALVAWVADANGAIRQITGGWLKKSSP